MMVTEVQQFKRFAPRIIQAGSALNDPHSFINIAYWRNRIQFAIVARDTVKELIMSREEARGLAEELYGLLREIDENDETVKVIEIGSVRR